MEPEDQNNWGSTKIAWVYKLEEPTIYKNCIQGGLGIVAPDNHEFIQSTESMDFAESDKVLPVICNSLHREWGYEGLKVNRRTTRMVEYSETL
jgi:hypothetical protein